MGIDDDSFRIELKAVSKRFGHRWIIKQFSASYSAGATYGVKGRNGSGKSTLMRILAGQLSPTRGQINHLGPIGKIRPENIYASISWTGPYIEIMEELTVAQQLTFHFALKPVQDALTTDQILERIELLPHRARKMRDCSSGMRQRVLLATALYAATPVMLLDEPTVMLDAQSMGWFRAELERFKRGRLCIIASNDARDLESCESVVSL